MSGDATIRVLKMLAAGSLLMLAISVAAGAQQVSDSGPAGNAAAFASNDQGPRSYVPSLFGQQPIAVETWQPQVPSNESAPPVAVVDGSTEQMGAVDPWAPYVRNPAQHYLLYGMNFSATYEHDSSFDGSPANSQAMSQLAPYVGLMGRTRTGYFVLQYAPSILPYDPALGETVAFHNFSFDAAGAFTRRLSWSFDTRVGYGGEMGRLTSNLNSQTVASGVSESDPSFASVEPLTGKSINAGTGAGLGYQLNQRDSIHGALSDTYSGFVYQPANSEPNLRDNIIGLGLSFDHIISPTMTLHAYGNGDSIYSNVLPCHSFSGGLGLTYRPSRNVTADFGAGPSSGCGAEAANFHANLAATLRNRVRVYVGSAREMNTAYRLNTRWEDNVTAGASKQFGHADLGFDAGYFHGQPLGLVGPSSGYFVAPRINYSLRLSRVSGISFSYRRFEGSSGSGPGVSFAMVTLMFTPAPLPLEK